MKRLSTGVLTACCAVALGLTTVIASASPNAAQGNNGLYALHPAQTAQTVAQAQTSPPPEDFGAPPSGEVPILFNDHHVYAKPDTLRANRVLAALVRGGTILVPLRSMFEQMGATVAYDPSTKTVDVTKPGSDVKVTVGKPEVVINGESRPLDVPPMLYKGALVVPVRVISEGMGAYVLWVADKRLVVVRYLAAPIPTPPPPPPPTAPPPPPPPATAPPPTPTPTPTPKREVYEKFLVGDYIFSPKVYNELSPGNSGRSSYHVAGAVEFPLFNLPWMLEGDYRQFTYPHNQGIPTPAIRSGPGSPCIKPDQPTDEGCVNEIGNEGYIFVPAFEARESDFDGRFAFKVADPRIYVGVGYLFRSTNYGYPSQNGVGGGIEKLPDLDQTFSIYGSAYYYPSVTARYTDPSGNQFDLQYRVFKYAVGGALSFKGTPFFLDFGYLGDRGYNKQNAPADFNHEGPYGGLGIHF